MTNEKPQAVFRPTPKGPRYMLAPFVPTPQDVIDRMLRLAEVTSDDLVYDLGCGDGRIIITAALEYGARGVGVDIEPYRVEQSHANARNAGVENLVTFSLGDALSLELSPATVVTLYLIQWSTEKMQALIINSVRPGTRVVSHNYELEADSVKFEEFTDASGETHKLHLWVASEASAL